MEIELKLTFPPDARRAIERHPRLAALKTGRATHRELYSAYYDTPDERLRQARAALRIRRDGGAWVQTLKTAGIVVAGLHQRQEFDWPIGRPILVRERLAELCDSRGGVLPADFPLARLRQAFVTRFLRTAYDITLPDGSVAEVAIDSGQIEARGRTAPVSEIEIELKRGEPAALYALALELARDLPVRVGVTSKAERGYMLGRAIRNAPVKAEPIDLAPGITLGAVAGRVVGHCVAQLLANEAGFLVGRDIEYLHQLRVASRRLRAAIAAFAPLFPARELNLLRSELRWLAQTLGPARDWDVWCNETLPRIVATAGPGPAAPADLRAVVRASAAARSAANGAARAAVESSRFTQLILRIGQILALGLQREEALLRAASPARPTRAITLAREAGLLGPADEYARRFLSARYAKLRKRDPVAGSSHERHSVRIAAKKLRYSAEFFTPLVAVGRRGRRIARTLRAIGAATADMQGVLGALNDLAVGDRMLGEIATRSPRIDPAARALVHGWIAGRSDASLAAVAPSWRVLREIELDW